MGTSAITARTGYILPSILGRETRPTPDRELPTVRLTQREVEVLTLVVEGMSSKEVAELLFVSRRTVENHLAKIYDKLKVSNRVQAFREASRRGLLP